MWLTGPAASVQTALAIYTRSSPKSPNHQAQEIAYHRVWEPRFPAVISSRNGSIPSQPTLVPPAVSEGFKKHPEELGRPLAGEDEDSPAS